MNVTPLLHKLIARQDLSEIESAELFDAILAGELSEGQIGAALAALATKGETITEVVGAARAMRRRAARVQALTGAVLDTVGTGGDGGMTFNVSTTVAFVAAGAGATVAKHGNRASSGRSGSADCLEQLGFNLQVAPEIMEQALNEIGICFLFAPTFHSAMKHAAPVRRQMGIRTIFNMLGPLTNPAGASCQLIGVFKPELTEMFAYALRELGSRRVLIVHGSDGMDEITLTGPSRCSELKDGVIRTYNIDPANFFGDYCTNEDLAGGEPSDNAAITRGVLAGEIHGPKRDIVLLNAAASLLAVNRVSSLEEGVAAAAKAIDSGTALTKLQSLIEFSA